MRDITAGVFEHLEIISPMDVDKRTAYTQRIGSALKEYLEVLVTCRQSTKELTGDEWNLGKTTGLSAEELWTWEKTDTTGYDGHDYLAQDKCVDFKRELWFKLVKCMRRKHLSVYQDHMKYSHNDILKPFKAKIICYAEHVCETLRRISASK